MSLQDHAWNKSLTHFTGEKLTESAPLARQRPRTDPPALMQILIAHVEKLQVWYLHLILFQRGKLKAVSLSLWALGLHWHSHFACWLLSSQNTQLSLYVLFLLLFPKHLLWATAEKGCCAGVALTPNCLPSWTQDLTTQLFNLHPNVLPKRGTTIETECACNIKDTHFGYITLSINEIGGRVVVLYVLFTGKLNSTCNRNTKSPATIKCQINNRNCQRFKLSTAAHLPCIYL